MLINQKIETGDTVRHAPSGETWIVACVEGEDLSWCGWPEGYGSLCDCELVQKATPEERRELLERLAEMDSSDHRAQYAQRVLARQTALKGEKQNGQQ